MDSYLNALEDELTRAAATGHMAAVPHGTRRRRLLATGGALAGVALAVAIGVLSLPVDRQNVAEAAELAVLDRPAVDISTRAGDLPSRVARDMDLSRARTFETDRGTGYVLLSDDRSSICVVVPDPPAGFGSTCGKVETVQREGLVAERVAPTPDSGRSSVFVVQPLGARPPELRDRAGTSRPLAVRAGVATATIERAGMLVVDAASGPRSLPVRPYEPQGQLTLDCGGGRFVEVHDARPVGEERMRELCGR
ncbi:MAG TPA: hypothetical protein VN238_06085 [Solirubrobacteraceae bacterium]|nr:hypothetical protein [Solirubrobacteraceae bacterium]